MPEPSAIRPKNIHADRPPVDPRSGCRRPHAKGAETGSAAKANAEKRVRRRHEKTAPSVGRSGRQAMSDLMYPPNKLLGIRCRALSGLRGRTLSGFGLSARLFALLRTSTLGFLLSGRLLGSRLVVGRVLLGLLGTCNRTAHHHHCCQCCQCLFHGLEILEGLTPFIVRAVVRNPFRPKKDQAACRRQAISITRCSTELYTLFKIPHGWGKVWTCGVDAWKKSTRLPSLRHSRPEEGGFAAGSSPADAPDRNARAVVQRIRISEKRSRRERGGETNAIRNGERSRYKGPRLSVAAPPADRLRTAIRLSPHVPADPYTVVRQNLPTNQRPRNCPSHERFYPHCVRSPSTPAAKQARSIRRQRRTGDFSARKIQKSEFVRRSAAAGPTRAPGDGPAAATGMRRTSGFAVAMPNKLQKNRSPRARQSPLLRSRQSSDTAPPAPRSSKQYGLGRYRETVLPPSSKRIPQLIRHRGGKKTRKAEATKTNVEKPRAHLSTRSRRDGACYRGFCGRCRALWQPATCCRPRPRAHDGCAAPRSRDRGAA